MARSSTAVKIVRMPMTKPPRGLRLVPAGAMTGGGFRGRARRVYHRAKGFAIANKAVSYPLAGAAALGLLERTGVELPFEIPMIGKAGTLAVALFAVGHFAKMPGLKLLSIGPACVAVHGLASGSGVSGFDVG